jgi:phenylalanyl-tRNA synthetase beta chain
MSPLSEDRTVMRTSLLPGLLEALRRARRRGERAVRLFTIGSRFLPAGPAGSAATSNRPRLPHEPKWLPEERPSFAAVLAGARPAYLTKPEDVDVYDAKGVAEELVQRLTGVAASVRSAASDKYPHLHPRSSGELWAGELLIGTFGTIHPDVVTALDLDGSLEVIELDLSAVERLEKPTPRYKPIPKLPAVTRDISLTVSDDVSAGDVAEVLRNAAGELCESVQLFDLFRGASIPENHRSLAFRLVYRDPLAKSDPDRARTLTDKEVDERHTRVVRAATERLGGMLRV